MLRVVGFVQVAVHRTANLDGRERSGYDQRQRRDQNSMCRHAAVGGVGLSEIYGSLVEAAGHPVRLMGRLQEYSSQQHYNLRLNVLARPNLLLERGKRR